MLEITTQLDEEGYKLRDVSVKGDSTATLLAQDSLHPVAEVIHQRIKEGSKPGVRRDGYKIGLSLEGGTVS